MCLFPFSHSLFLHFFLSILVFFNLPPLPTCCLLFFLTSRAIFIVLPPHSHPPSLSDASSFPLSTHLFPIFISFLVSFFSLLFPPTSPLLNIFHISFPFRDQFPHSFLLHFILLYLSTFSSFLFSNPASWSSSLLLLFFSFLIFFLFFLNVE